MTGADALDRLRAAYDDRSGTIAARKAAGERLVGYFLNSVPVELMLAADLSPVRLVGDPARGSVRADAYMEEFFDGEIRAIFEAMLAGDHAAMDLVVIPRSSEVYLQLYYFLLEIPRWEPEAKLPPIHLFDLLQTPRWTSARYDMGRMKAFADRLAEAGGATVDDERLAQAIRTVNQVRALLTQVSQLWRGRPRCLSGVDALKVIGGVGILEREEMVLALEALLADPPMPLPEGGPRVMIKGSPQHDPRFTALVESCGVSVVAHDHVAGDRLFETPVSTEGNPWEALVHRYQREIPGPRAYPQAREDQRMLALARQAEVDGVVIIHDEWDDTLGWEYPDQKTLLDANGIPSLFLKRQPWFTPDEDAQRAAVSAFVVELGGSPA